MQNAWADLHSSSVPSKPKPMTMKNSQKKTTERRKKERRVSGRRSEDRQKQIPISTRVTVEFIELLDALGKTLEAEKRSDVIRMILHQALGYKTLEGVPRIVESIRQEREAGYRVPPSVPSEVPDQFIALLEEVSLELQMNRAELKKIGDFYHKRFCLVEQKIEESTEKIAVRLDRQMRLFQANHSRQDRIETAIASIDEKVEALMKYFKTVFVQEVKEVSFGVIDNFVNRFFSHPGNDDSQRDKCR